MDFRNRNRKKIAYRNANRNRCPITAPHPRGKFLPQYFLSEKYGRVYACNVCDQEIDDFRNKLEKKYEGNVIPWMFLKSPISYSS